MFHRFNEHRTDFKYIVQPQGTHNLPYDDVHIQWIEEALAWLTRWLHAQLGTQQLLWLAVGVFVVAWIAQFIGHGKLFEGRKPSFLTDLKYLLVGPAWVLARLYRKLGWKY